MPPSARCGIVKATPGRAEVPGHGQPGGDRAPVAAQPGDEGAQLGPGASGGYPFLQIGAAALGQLGQDDAELELVALAQAAGVSRKPSITTGRHSPQQNPST